MSQTLYPVVLDRDTIASILTTINVNTLAIHHPGRDGLCPVCGERMCAIRLAAVKAVRAAG